MPSTLVFWRQWFSLACDLQSGLAGQLVPGFPCLYLPSTGIAGMFHRAWLFLCGCWKLNSDNPGARQGFYQLNYLQSTVSLLVNCLHLKWPHILLLIFKAVLLKFFLVDSSRRVFWTLTCLWSLLIKWQFFTAHVPVGFFLQWAFSSCTPPRLWFVWFGHQGSRAVPYHTESVTSPEGPVRVFRCQHPSTEEETSRRFHYRLVFTSLGVSRPEFLLRRGDISSTCAFPNC